MESYGKFQDIGVTVARGVKSKLFMFDFYLLPIIISIGEIKYEILYL